MLKKVSLVFMVLMVCLLVNSPISSAADQWFYTAPNGDQYYLRQYSATKPWKGGHVVVVNSSSMAQSFFYLIDPMRDVSYTIYNGTDFDKIDYKNDVVEKGTIKGNDAGKFKNSARALYEMLF